MLTPAGETQAFCIELSVSNCKLLSLIARWGIKTSKGCSRSIGGKMQKDLWQQQKIPSYYIRKWTFTLLLNERDIVLLLSKITHTHTPTHTLQINECEMLTYFPCSESIKLWCRLNCEDLCECMCIRIWIRLQMNLQLFIAVDILWFLNSTFLWWSFFLLT